MFESDSNSKLLKYSAGAFCQLGEVNFVDRSLYQGPSAYVRRGGG